MDELQLNWQFLDAIFNDFGLPHHTLYETFKSKEDRLNALKDVLGKGEIPMLGQRAGAFGLKAPVRIEEKLASFLPDIRILENEVEIFKEYGPDLPKTGIAVFKRVQADQTSLERHFLGSDDREAECRDWLASRPENPRLKKRDAFNKFNERRKLANKPPIGWNAFGRAWKEGAPSSWRNHGRLKG
jgi:hypothetical protein